MAKRKAALVIGNVGEYEIRESGVYNPETRKRVNQVDVVKKAIESGRYEFNSLLGGKSRKGQFISADTKRAVNIEKDLLKILNVKQLNKEAQEIVNTYQAATREHYKQLRSAKGDPYYMLSVHQGNSARKVRETINKRGKKSDLDSWNKAEKVEASSNLLWTMFWATTVDVWAHDPDNREKLICDYYGVSNIAEAFEEFKSSTDAETLIDAVIYMDEAVLKSWGIPQSQIEKLRGMSYEERYEFVKKWL